jgi:hypothetical protein
MQPVFHRIYVPLGWATIVIQCVLVPFRGTTPICGLPRFIIGIWRVAIDPAAFPLGGWILAGATLPRIPTQIRFIIAHTRISVVSDI